jgi:O-methyltransferase
LVVGLLATEFPRYPLAVPTDISTLYLDLLKRTLTRYDLGDLRYPIRSKNATINRMLRFMTQRLRPLGLELDRVKPFDPAARYEGRDQPYDAETMIGIQRLNNLERCVSAIVEEGIPGDLLEAGVWRGGSVIFMRALLEVLGDRTRTVWAADSFRGLPRPDPSITADRNDRHHENLLLAVALEDVKKNFRKYGLLDARVQFLEGWFSDTLVNAPIQSLALLRADGDMYGSTMDILVPLYPKLSKGGFVIIDDYGAVPGCRQAVADFRREKSITDPMITIDWAAVYWRKSSS